MGLFGIGNKKKLETANNTNWDYAYWDKRDKYTGELIRPEKPHRVRNKDYAELVEFDRNKSGYPIHKKLRLYVEAKGTYHLDYYIAKLSHEVFKTRGTKGHIGREVIRKNLKEYAWKVLRERSN